MCCRSWEEDVVVCPLMARANHSCRPNAEFVARVDKGAWSYHDDKDHIIMARANHSCRSNAEFVARVDKGASWNDKNHDMIYVYKFVDYLTRCERVTGNVCDWAWRGGDLLFYQSQFLLTVKNLFLNADNPITSPICNYLRWTSTTSRWQRRAGRSGRSGRSTSGTWLTGQNLHSDSALVWDNFWQIFFPRTSYGFQCTCRACTLQVNYDKKCNQQIPALMMLTKQKEGIPSSMMIFGQYGNGAKMYEQNDEEIKSFTLSFLSFWHYLLCYIQLWDHLLAVRSYWNLHWGSCFDQVSCVFDALPEAGVDNSVGLSFYPMTVSISARISKGGDKFEGPCVNSQITQTLSFPDDMKNVSRALS